MRLLRAGPVTVLLDGIDLRYLRIGGTELVRRVYAAVRDVDWDTVPGVVSGLEIEESDDGFRIEFDVRHARREVDFAWHGTITGRLQVGSSTSSTGVPGPRSRTTASASASTTRGAKRPVQASRRVHPAARSTVRSLT